MFVPYAVNTWKMSELTPRVKEYSVAHAGFTVPCLTFNSFAETHKPGIGANDRLDLPEPNPPGGGYGRSKR